MRDPTRRSSDLQKRRGTQQAHHLDSSSRSGADHLRDPQHESVDPEAPEEILNAQKNYAWDAERRRQMSVLRQHGLLEFQRRLNLLAAFPAQPGRVARPVAFYQHPDKRP